MSFTNVRILNTGKSGIGGGTGVSNFTLANSIIDGVNTTHTSSDGDVTFNVNGGGATENNVSGTASITGNILNNSYQAGIDINNYAGDDFNPDAYRQPIHKFVSRSFQSRTFL